MSSSLKKLKSVLFHDINQLEKQRSLILASLYWTWGKAINDKLMVCYKMAGHFYLGKNLKYEGILFLSANFKSK